MLYSHSDFNKLKNTKCRRVRQKNIRERGPLNTYRGACLCLVEVLGEKSPLVKKLQPYRDIAGGLVERPELSEHACVYAMS